MFLGKYPCKCSVRLSAGSSSVKNIGFYEGIVKRGVVKVVGLQIDFIVLEINEYIESFEEIIAYHAVYVPFARHP